MNHRSQITLPFGNMRISTSWEQSVTNADFTLKGGFFEPRLPSGRAVEFAYAIVGELQSDQVLTDFRSELRFLDEVTDSGPETGQYLDAQSFKLGDLEIYLGTEDLEMLSYRYAWFDSNEQHNVAAFPSNGLDLSLVKIPRNTLFSYHYVIAAQVPKWDASLDEADISAWFAVDVPHKDLTRLRLAGIQPQRS